MSRRVEQARAEVAELESQCAIAFDRGTRARGALDVMSQCWEYHRLSEKRREARERLALCLRLDAEPVNDNHHEGAA